uniref:Uncharacterized protein n=1 Tax=Myoviridae sp. ctCo31 TaxID=2825053 RepID=A0A8S5UM70_9CAUD|nr:MAG TPA: hypothetical protein [Myoviridae sp. ctCo31]
MVNYKMKIMMKNQKKKLKYSRIMITQKMIRLLI